MDRREPPLPEDVAGYRRLDGWRRTRFDRLQRTSGGVLATLQLVAGIVFVAIIVSLAVHLIW